MSEPIAPAMRILNLDDNEVVRYTRGQILRRAGFEVTDACTGGEALQMARKRRFDVAVLDVKLPDMSGLDVTRQMRLSRKNRAMRIVQISAVCTSERDEMAGLENGADVYLRHPFDTRDLPGVVSGLAMGSTGDSRAKPKKKASTDLAAARAQRERAYAELMSIGAELRALRLERHGEGDAARAARLAQQCDSLQAQWDASFLRYSSAYADLLAALPSYPDMCWVIPDPRRKPQ
jgi:DNA-binding response OmpR family regulator